ncbi:MAG TPA: hypothetical protein DDY79_15720 [Brevundimonas sp.]|nr:hypothetical protein [Brevundimonas sp.]
MSGFFCDQARFEIYFHRVPKGENAQVFQTKRLESPAVPPRFSSDKCGGRNKNLVPVAERDRPSRT